MFCITLDHDNNKQDNLKAIFLQHNIFTVSMEYFKDIDAK